MVKAKGTGIGEELGQIEAITGALSKVEKFILRDTFILKV